MQASHKKTLKRCQKNVFTSYFNENNCDGESLLSLCKAAIKIYMFGSGQIRCISERRVDAKRNTYILLQPKRVFTILMNDASHPYDASQYSSFPRTGDFRSFYFPERETSFPNGRVNSLSMFSLTFAERENVLAARLVFLWKVL